MRPVLLTVARSKSGVVLAKKTNERTLKHRLKTSHDLLCPVVRPCSLTFRCSC